MAQDRIRVVLVFGGQSAEHEVSRVSAAHVAAALDPDRYDVVPVGIDRDGGWALAEGARDMLAAATAPDSLPTAGPAIDPLPTLRGPASIDRHGHPSRVVALPVLHGPNGEDGTIQGMFELADIAYVGSGVLGSALAMDKAAAKEMLAGAGLPQAAFRWGVEDELDDAFLDEVIDALGLPLFVKPANMGSSVGVSKVSSTSQMRAAVDTATAHDEVVVFEEAIVGREIEIAVLGTRELRVSVPGEIVPAAEFYDYDDKYRDGSAELLIPAPLSDVEVAEAQDLATRAYRALRAEVMARVDLFLPADGRGFLVNEVNTIPGCTPISMFPALWEASGLSYPELLDEMIRLSIERHDRRGRRRR